MVGTHAVTARPPQRTGAIEALRLGGGAHGGRVAFRNARVTDIAPALVGRPADRAPRLARMLMPVCGWAQGLAGLAAVEAARGIQPDPATAAARAMLALAETGVGLVWHACLDWPPLVGAARESGCLRYARTALDTLVARLWSLADPLDPSARAQPILAGEPAMSALIEAIQRAVLPRAPADPRRLADWARRDPSPLARLVRHPGPALPAPAVPPPGPLATVAAALAEDPGFGRAPAAPGGGPADPGMLARLPPDLASGAMGFGAAGARFLARAHLALDVIEALERLAPPPIEAICPAPGVGAARVEGMRGPLVHRLEVDGAGRIAAFASVAPTEWMLHPAGPFAAALAALPVDEFTAAAAHVVAAFDPCAPVEPRTAEAADA
ncbi:MAG: hypothetical protein KJZ85_04295 [Rhodobacteraceae bacterium]|nr:hypothetical protein [Paracoccaceae bacterium]